MPFIFIFEHTMFLFSIVILVSSLCLLQVYFAMKLVVINFKTFQKLLNYNITINFYFKLQQIAENLQQQL